ncbi:50S ribosomal protein L29 [bacterium]|nr:50S ribosomal protein L29 [bacterium]
MKIEKFREMNQTELEHKMGELQGNLFKLKIKVQTKQIENTAQLSASRRDIARIKTLLKEMRLADIKTTAAAEQRKR